MSKTLIASLVAIFFISVYSIYLAVSSGRSSQANTTEKVSPQNIAPAHTHIPADRIDVVNFFGTQRCVSCLAVGRLTKGTLEKKFSAELASGKIVFKEINGELPENEEIVIQYQARGSSLFTNAVQDGKDEIIEDVKVWSLVNNEDQFITYLENKLNTLLGK